MKDGSVLVRDALPPHMSGRPFDESKHARNPAGMGRQSGEFASMGGGKAGAADRPIISAHAKMPISTGTAPTGQAAIDLHNRIKARRESEEIKKPKVAEDPRKLLRSLKKSNPEQSYHEGVAIRTYTRDSSLINTVLRDPEQLDRSLATITKQMPPEYADTYIREQRRYAEEAKQAAEHLRGWLDRATLPQDVTAHRFVRGDTADRLRKTAQAGGGEFEDKGFMSTSADPSFVRNAFLDSYFMAAAFGDEPLPVMVEIKMKQGQKAAAIAHISKYPKEREILVQAGSRLRITGLHTEEHVETTAGGDTKIIHAHIIHAELLQDEESSTATATAAR